MKEQYILTQDTSSIFRSIDTSGIVRTEEFKEAADLYLNNLREEIQNAVINITVDCFKEEEIEQSLVATVIPELQTDNSVCICLDRWLLSTLPDEYQTKVARFSITRRIDGAKVARQGISSFSEQIAAIKKQFGNIYDKQVLLVDDGIFSGGTVKEFLSVWESIESRPLPISRICTFIGNGSQIENLVPQTSVQSIPRLYEWIDIRDFGPWGGKQIAASKNNTVTASIPYLFPWSDGSSASLDKNGSFFEISSSSITASINLLNTYQRLSGNILTFRDLLKRGFPLPTDTEKKFSVSINDTVVQYLERARDKVVAEREREVFIFDMDGTLYQLDGNENGFSGSSLEQAVLENAFSFVCANITAGDIVLAKEIVTQGLVDSVGISMYLQNTFGISRTSYFDTVWDINPEGIVRQYETAVKTILQLKEQRPLGKLILLTSAPRSWANRVQEYLGLSQQFETIYTGDQFTIKKDIFTMLSQRYKPNNIISVGDQLATDILPAEELGMSGILVQQPSDIVQVLRNI